MPVDTTSTELATLVTSIREAVRLGLPAADTANVVADRLSGCLSSGLDLPERYREGDPERYLQHLIHAEPDGGFSVVALVWLPGHRTCIHDHVSWCVTGVYEGEEHEQRYELRGNGRYLVPIGHDDNAVGVVSALAPPGDIHMVSNSSTARTVSLHVYGADIAKLGCSIRRRYHQPVISG